MTRTWDELWETMPVVVYGLRGGKSTHANWLNKVKAEGDNLKEKAENWDNFCGWTLGKCIDAINAVEKLEAVKTWLIKAKAEGRVSMNVGFSLGLVLGVEE